MINIYDIARNENLLPKLVKVGEYKVERKITSENDTLIDFIHNTMKVNQYDNEHLYLISMDMYDRALGVFLLSIGTYKECETSKRNIAECLVLSGARHFIMIHNHPDGALSLSEGDEQFARSMKELAELLEIEFIGSFVITNDGIICNGMDKPIKFKRR